MSFEKAIDFTLRWEGGYVNDPADPGGETKFGISKRAYPAEDIRRLTLERARLIYCRDYWNAINAEELNPQLAIAAFDTAVNMGVTRAKQWLPQCSDYKDLIKLREDRYRLIAEHKPAMKKFLKGWLNRTKALRGYIEKA